MLPYPGQAPYFCSECKKQYNSASSLLNHFAKHISEKHGYHTNQSDSEDTERNDHSKVWPDGQSNIKAGNLLENVVKHTLAKQLLTTDFLESFNHYSSSSISEYCSSSSDTNNCSFELERQIPKPVIELEGRNSICTVPTNNLMLVKFDLQKRLENCIFKLASKIDSDMESSSGHVLNRSHNSWEKTGLILPVINSKDLTVTVASNANSTEHEEFNPLKFCIVTMEEGEDKLDLDRSSQLSVKGCGQSTNSLRVSSSQKQQAPEKIFLGGEKNFVNLDMVTEKSCTKKKYPCLVCCKVFGWSTDLKRHMLTHTGERPFRCRLCPATFTRNFLLQKHESKQHQSCTALDIKPTAFKHIITKGTSTSTKAGPIVSSCDRKRKIRQPSSGEFDSNVNEKKLELRQCSPLPVGIFSQQALNIS